MSKSHEERKSEIIEAALEIAADKGVGGATTQAIADRVGIAQPTVFRHFKSRNAIFEAAVNGIAEALFRNVSGLLEGYEPADDRLRELIRRQLRFIGRRRGVPRLLFSDRLHIEIPTLRNAVLGVMGRYEKAVTELIEEGVWEKRFREDLDPQETARVLIAMIQGLVVRWSLSNYAFELEDEAEAVWRLLWQGLKPDSAE
jgi:AcrR family transcriptional regulator